MLTKCWPETMVDGRNELAAPKETDILKKLAVTQRVDESYQPFGDGHSAKKIVAAMEACGAHSEEKERI